MSEIKFPRWAEIAASAGLVALSAYCIVGTRNGPGEPGGRGWIWHDFVAVGMFVIAAVAVSYAAMLWWRRRPHDRP